MHTIRFPLETGRRKEQVLDKGFRAMGKLHNIMAKEAKKRLRMLRRDKQYRYCKKMYASASEDDRGKYAAGMQERIRFYKLTETDFHAYIRIAQHMYRHLVSSHQAQEEASRVYAGVEKVLYSNGRDIHFKKTQDILTIAAKSMNGLSYTDPLHTDRYPKKAVRKYPEEVLYHGEHFRVKIDWDDPYVWGSLSHPLRYAQIERKMFPSGWRYYVILYLEGDAPLKHKGREGTAGLDPGVSTEAAVFDDECILAELAPKCKDYNRRITQKTRQVERSLRAANPDNYNPDGTIKKGKHSWTITASCARRKRELKSLCRRKAAYTKQSQEELADLLTGKANIFLAEEMDWKALQKRSKQPAQRREKASVIAAKDGTEKTVRRFKKKKRFGSSIRDRAPSQFLAILGKKCARQGGGIIFINTRAVKASRYDHSTGACKKVPLSKRTKEVDGHKVQRDLYSGFIIRHVQEDGSTVDRDSCIKDFDRFLKAQDECISKLKTSGGTYPACFGF